MTFVFRIIKTFGALGDGLVVKRPAVNLSSDPQSGGRLYLDSEDRGSLEQPDWQH